MILCKNTYCSQICCNRPLSVLMEIGMWSWWHVVAVLEMTHWCMHFLQTVDARQAKQQIHNHLMLVGYVASPWIMLLTL